ncbi:MAG: hypothetical protein ACYSU0_13795 [Planctomycetota bacterium]|jgi:hypothetical protein
MGFLGNLFKSKRKRQLEREMAVQQVLALHRRRIKELEGHERRYADMAVRARREGDKANFQKLLRLTAQTMNERRRLGSALLSFEALVQTQKRIEGYAQFADGMQKATRSIQEVFEGLDLTGVATKVQEAAMQAQSLDVAMTSVLDQVSVSLFETPEAAGLSEEIVSVEDVEKMLSEEAEGKEATADEEIKRLLGRVEDKLKEGS